MGHLWCGLHPWTLIKNLMRIMRYIRKLKKIIIVKNWSDLTIILHIWSLGDLTRLYHKFNTQIYYQMCTKYMVHMFNVWTIKMQSLNINEWKLLELQITQTRLSISDGKFNSPKIRKYQMCTKKEVHMFNVWSIIMQSLNIKEYRL